MPSSPDIRPFRESDTDAMAAWLTASEPWRTLGYRTNDWAPYFSAVAADPLREADVIESEGAAAGVAVVRRHVLAGDYLELFAIAPSARRVGLGRAFLDYVERRAFSRARNFYLCVSDFNTAARAFYRAAGYQEIGPIDELIVPGRSEVLMRKTIGPMRQP